MSGALLLWRSMRKRVELGAAFAVLLALATAALLATWIAGPPPATADAPVFALLVHGARSLVILIALSASVSLAAGVVLGAAAGLAGGAIDSVLARAVELIGAFPTVVVVTLVRAFDPAPNVLLTGLAVAIARLPDVARLVRYEVIRATSEEHALAATALGTSPLRIAIRHVGPQLAAPLAHCLAAGASAVVTIDTLIGFLGIGGAASTPSWGATIAAGLSSGRINSVSAMIGACLATAAAAQILASHVGDAFDPHAERATPCARRPR